MAKHLFRMFLWTVSLILAGCTVQRPVTPFAPMDLNPKIQSGQYIQNANNLMIILDNSGSMKDFYLGQRKFNMAKDIVNRINRTIPNIKLTIALRTFGFDILTSEETTLVYGPTPYHASGFEKAFREVKRPNGPSPLDLAIDAAIEDLSSTEVLGKIAMIIVSTPFKSEMIRPAECFLRKLHRRAVVDSTARVSGFYPVVMWLTL
ncbi:MAG: VWA domain-containing protein [Syntrophales bacterium]